MLTQLSSVFKLAMICLSKEFFLSDVVKALLDMCMEHKKLTA